MVQENYWPKDLAYNLSILRTELSKSQYADQQPSKDEDYANNRIRYVHRIMKRKISGQSHEVGLSKNGCVDEEIKERTDAAGFFGGDI